jgi:hypothetical protein
MRPQVIYAVARQLDGLNGRETPLIQTLRPILLLIRLLTRTPSLKFQKARRVVVPSAAFDQQASGGGTNAP